MVNLESLDCHFNWNLIDDSCEHLLEYLRTDITMNPDIEIPALLFISFLSYQTDHDLNSAISVINEALDKCTHHKNKSHAIGYKIVARGIKIHLLVEADDEDEIDKLFTELENLKPEANDEAKAAINGARGYALSSMNKNKYEEGMSYYKRAFRLDREHYAWPMGIAILLGRLRRIHEGQTFPTELEEELLQISIDLSDNSKALPIVFMADMYFAKGREMAQRKADEEWLEEAKRLYLKAFEMAPDCTHVLKRCGKAFSMMDDVEMAMKCLQRGIKLDPNNSVCHHRLGQVYEHKMRDVNKAKECYERAIKAHTGRNLFAEMDLARIHKKLDVTYDLMDHYQKMKLEYGDDERAHKHLDEAIRRQSEYEERAKERRQNGFNSNRPRNLPRYQPRNNNNNNTRPLLPTPTLPYLPHSGFINTSYQPQGVVIGHRYQPRRTPIVPVQVTGFVTDTPK